MLSRQKRTGEYRSQPRGRENVANACFIAAPKPKAEKSAKATARGVFANHPLGSCC